MFVDIENTDGFYQINESGEVKSIERIIYRKDGSPLPLKEKIIKHLINNKTGYYQVGLYLKNGYFRKYVHRLVAEAFIPNPENKPCIDHIDGDKNNNHVSNLRWCTYKENMNNKITKKRISENKKGKNHKKRVNPVAQYDLKTNEIINTYESAMQASIATNINYVGIWNALTKRKCTKNGYSWYTKSAGGYGWRYLH